MYFFMLKKYILYNKMLYGGNMLQEVLEYLPDTIEFNIKKFLKENAEAENNIEEIRLRTNQKLTLKIGQGIHELDYVLNREEVSEAFENVCEKSIYSYTKQIAEGFITIKGGNRVGITGSCVMEKGKVININYISSLNFRIARQIKDASNSILRYIIDIKNDTIFNTLIVSAPGARKNDNLKRFNKKII